MSPMLITVVAFLAITGLMAAVLFMGTAKSPVEQRLKKMLAQGAPEAAEARKAEDRSIFKTVLAALGNYGVGGGDSALARKLSMAGVRGPNSTLHFLGIRTLLSFGPALAVLVPRVSAGKPLGPTLGVAAAFWFVGHMIVNLRLRQMGRRRSSAITVVLPDTLDLMVVCLEAGLGLNAAIARVGKERSTMKDPLGDEFAVVSLELRSGRTREQALRGLGERNGVGDLKTLTGMIIQCDRLGASMGTTLRSPSDLLRTKPRQRAEEAARKPPIKPLPPGTACPRGAAASSGLELRAGTLPETGLKEGARVEIEGDVERPRGHAATLTTAISNVALACLYVFFASAHFEFARRTGQWRTAMPIVVLEAMLVFVALTRRRSLGTSARATDWAIGVVGAFLPLLLRPGEGPGPLAQL